MTKGAWYNSLSVLTVALLTLALFPLGAVAIYQTNRVAAEAERNAQLALLAITGRAAHAEEVVIERAFGAARVLATKAGDYVDAPDRCRTDFSAFVHADDRFSFVGILPLSGEMTCSSSGAAYDSSQFPEFDKIMADQKRTLSVNTQAPMSGQSVFIVSEPFKIDGAFAGFISLSVPHAGLPDTSNRLTDLGLTELMTFNEDGQVLTARSPLADAVQELPSGRSLKELTGMQQTAFQDTNQTGERRTYTVVPIQGSPTFVIGVWRKDARLAQQVKSNALPWLFPVLMWCASMGVAMLSIYMLVLRHLVKLRNQMTVFANSRNVDPQQATATLPNEIQALYDNFARMTNDVLHDEATLEDTVREKNVLIKEVHHRVKNNLQLISSIMNMQIRTAKQDETKTVLARLQDRVLSLATIHRDLYQSQNGGMVDVGRLVAEVVENSIEVAIEAEGAIDLKTDIDPVLLYPDQAVPLSLLVAEAATNALKYLDSAAGQRPVIDVSLKQDGAECALRIINTRGTTTDVESTGLGSQLMNAFAIQLGGQIETDETPDRFTLSISFPVADFVPETRDF